MVNAELLRIVDSISRDKKIEKDMIFDDIEAAMVSAVRKAFGQAEDVTVKIDRLTGEVTAERDALQEELAQALSHIEAEASQAQQLRDNLAALEPEARAAGELRQEVKELNHQVRHGNAAMAQETGHWKDRFQQEEKSRQDAESLAAKRNSEINQLKAENQRLTKEVREIPGHSLL